MDRTDLAFCLFLCAHEIRQAACRADPAAHRVEPTDDPETHAADRRPAGPTTSTHADDGPATGDTRSAAY